MTNLSDDSVWFFDEETRKESDRIRGIKCFTYLCNYGSKSNFLKLISNVRPTRGNWVKDRISESGNVLHLELSKLYPESFICFTTRKIYSNAMEDIVTINVQPKPTKK